jgi:hypothetical protein
MKAWIWDGGWQSKLEWEGQQLLSRGKLVVSNTAQALINFFPTLDSQGWTFTHGFPCSCSAAKAYITCVRRKEGVCHRQFHSQFWSILRLVTMFENYLETQLLVVFQCRVDHLVVITTRVMNFRLGEPPNGGANFVYVSLEIDSIEIHQ